MEAEARQAGSGRSVGHSGCSPMTMSPTASESATASKPPEPRPERSSDGMTSARNVGAPTLLARLGAGRSVGMLLALLLLCVIGVVTGDGFLTGGNALNVGQQISIVGIMAVGMTMVIIGGEIDLSVGSIYALSSVLTAEALLSGLAAGPAVLIGLLVGAGAGALNGILVVTLRIPSFIVTLGTLSVYRGAALLSTGGTPISLDATQRSAADLSRLGQGRLLGLPVQFFIFLLVIAVGAFLLHRIRFGYHVFAVGGSPEASRLCGLPVARIKIITFAFNGLMAALAGIVGLAFLQNVQGVSGQGLELVVITTVIVGGASLFGGSGSVGGTVVGVLLIGVLQNVLVLAGISSFWQTTAIGVVIIAAVAADTLFRRRRL